VGGSRPADLVGAFYDALMESKREGSATQVQNFLRQFGYGFPSLPSTHKDFDNLYMRGASGMIEGLINDGLNAGPNRDPQSRQGKRRTWWGLKAVGPGDFVLLQYPPDLVSRAYSAFAWLIANNVETRFCEVCYKQFVPTPRQKGDVCSERCRNTLKSRKRRSTPD
jgi:predicted nucleic acid-binding Zn ribbon protein